MSPVGERVEVPNKAVGQRDQRDRHGVIEKLFERTRPGQATMVSVRLDAGAVVRVVYDECRFL
jgi:hypothetical protein